MCQVIFVYSLSNNGEGNDNFLENYYKLAQPLQSLYYMLFAICTVSVFDRYVSEVFHCKYDFTAFKPNLASHTVFF